MAARGVRGAIVRPTWAVIPTKNRPELVRRCLRAITDQVWGIMLVDNNDTPDFIEDDVAGNVVTVHHPGYPPSVSELYNAGLDPIYTDRDDEWNVVLLNDDVIVPPGWVETLDSALRASTAIMAFVDPLSRSQLLTRPDGSAATVWACMLRGEAHLRFDETMRWWYSDNDLDYRCRRSGGTLAVSGVVPEHLHPSAQTFADAELSAQTHRDRVTFEAKWSGVVW